LKIRRFFGGIVPTRAIGTSLLGVAESEDQLRLFSKSNRKLSSNKQFEDPSLSELLLKIKYYDHAKDDSIFEKQKMQKPIRKTMGLNPHSSG
jgi:hypothetical protein